MYLHRKSLETSKAPPTASLLETASQAHSDVQAASAEQSEMHAVKDRREHMSMVCA
jgi:hypothetical protein